MTRKKNKLVEGALLEDHGPGSQGRRVGGGGGDASVDTSGRAGIGSPTTGGERPFDPQMLLHSALGLHDAESPFPWQEALLRRFLDGNVPSALDVPTGLGKTATMAVWLVARSLAGSFTS